MKKLAITILVVLFSTTVTLAQNKMKGPAAKNYKVWQHKQKQTQLVDHNVEKISLKGPAAKNYQPRNYDREILLISTIHSSGRVGLKGPAAKNYKPQKVKQVKKDTIHVPDPQPVVPKPKK